MGKNDLYITVPSFFRCPISLDVMKSPVSLSTGVTYDRTSIQRWLDCGNNTCPATMQVLDTKDFVPNHTLQRLIQIWSNNNNCNTNTMLSNTSLQFHSLTKNQVIELIQHISPETRFETFVKILCFASESLENRKLLASNEDFLYQVVHAIASEGPDLDPDLLEAVLKIFQLILSSLDNNLKPKILKAHPNLIPSLANVLKTGRSDSRAGAAGILETIAPVQESKKAIFEDDEIIIGLLEVLRSGSGGSEMQAVLSCLISLSSPRRNKIKLVRAGGVRIIGDIFSSTDGKDHSGSIIELLLTLLEMLVGCTEGRTAITEYPNFVQRIVQKLMKVSRSANEHGVALLWSLCYLFRDQKAREAMTKSNGGLTKILLLMQSDCSPAVKRMCCDLLRIFRVNSKSCLSSYDTKTTHIMPC